MFDLCTWYEYLSMFILEIYVSNQNTIPNYFFYALSSRNCVLDAADIWQGALRIPKLLRDSEDAVSSLQPP